MNSDNIILQDTIDLLGITSEEEFIPLMTDEEEEKISSKSTPKTLSILPLRNTVLFPGVVIPITVGRDKSIRLINDSNKKTKIIGVVSQKNQDIEDPDINELNTTGTVAKIMRVFRMPDGNTTVIIQGQKRFKIEELTQKEPYIKAKVSSFDEISPKNDSEDFKVLIATIKDLATKIIKESPNIPTEATFALKNIKNPSFLVNFISSNLNIDVNEKQNMLEEIDLKIRAKKTLKHLTHELQMLEMKNEIQTKVKTDLDQQQREYYLNQQLKTIQEELGGNIHEEEIEEMKKNAGLKKWNKEVSEHFNKELRKLQRMNPQSPDFTVHRNYLELLLDLPWDEVTNDNFDLNRAKKILDKDHYGLDKVKERILEHLAVLKIKGDMKSPIICLYGPPGVGKTSLGRSIAQALGRKYVRMSLGGLRDEAEVRGHRKTYIGAMPGRVIQSIKRSKSSNPVFVLDELDKMTRDAHGDPSSAMLEVLDPEQNHEFYDNYLELGYDLSKVMFIATANTLGNIQPALRDRMEIIEINGYTVEEKVEIAKRHLIPKQLKSHGLTNKHLKINKKLLVKIVENYTKESGVRGLEKVIAKLVRFTAKSIAMEQDYNQTLNDVDVENILGAKKFDMEKYHSNDVAGVATGLAWTAVGGDILFIESSLSPGKSKLNLTGNLGDVMKESALIALEYIKANAEDFNVSASLFENSNVHIHVPEGATPKDGPSAGITMLTSLLSLFTQKKVKEKLAMTGEITLRGKVLPVGGIKEKILAAKRANIKEIILCKENQKDINEINERYLKGLTFLYVDEMKDVIKLALTNKLVQKPKKFALN